MRNTVLFLAAVALSGALLTGCANQERKLGRGVSNIYEVVRVGELRRTMEQTALFDGPDVSYTTGFFRGMNRTLARVGLGVYEVATFPLPPYDPLCPDFLAPRPVFPDNYVPGLVEDSMFGTDHNLGFSGGDVFPMVPGSRYRIFDTH
jgi:putative exosortase-associated protein (TIGR04073 family)